MVIQSRSLCVCFLVSAAVLTAGRSRADDATEQKSTQEKDKEKPTKGPGWVWANAEGGIETANLTTFNASLDTLTAGLTPTSGVGPAAGIGAGLRIYFFTLGLRGRVATLESPGAREWQLWTLNAEAGLRVRVSRLEPYLTLGGGYASVGNFASAISGFRSGLDISGANLRAGAGLDFYLFPALSVGVALTGEALILARQGVPLQDLAAAKQIGSINDARARVLEVSGSSVGAALTATLGVGLHF